MDDRFGPLTFPSRCELPVSALPILLTDHEPRACHREESIGRRGDLGLKPVARAVREIASPLARNDNG